MRASTVAQFNADTPMFPMFAAEAAEKAAAEAKAKAERREQRANEISLWANGFGRMNSESVPRDFC